MAVENQWSCIERCTKLSLKLEIFHSNQEVLMSIIIITIFLHNRIAQCTALTIIYSTNLSTRDWLMVAKRKHSVTPFRASKRT